MGLALYQPKEDKKFIDMTGMTYGRLKIISKSHKDKNGVWYWECLCECGNFCIKRGYAIRYGSTKSCGCLEKENLTNLPKSKIIHNKTNTSLYNVWKSMRQRCNNKNDHRFHRYGGRGIKVCSEWNANYLLFEEWAINNGYIKGLTIDRIDNDGNYTPSNCRFISRTENNRNSSQTHLTQIAVNEIRHKYNNMNIKQKELASIYGVTQQTISRIINFKSWNNG